MRKLEDFVSADHPLRTIRLMVSAALVKMAALFSGMYDANKLLINNLLRINSMRFLCRPCRVIEPCYRF
jgi:hypothetical protein